MNFAELHNQDQPLLIATAEATGLPRPIFRRSTG